MTFLFRSRFVPTYDIKLSGNLAVDCLYIIDCL